MATFLLVTIILDGLMALADTLMRGLLGMRSEAVVESRIVAPVDALPIGVVLPAPIATGNHTLRAFSVLLRTGGSCGQAMQYAGHSNLPRTLHEKGPFLYPL